MMEKDVATPASAGASVLLPVRPSLIMRIPRSDHDHKRRIHSEARFAPDLAALSEDVWVIAPDLISPVYLIVLGHLNDPRAPA